MENFISEQVFASSTWSYFERAIARFLIHRGWEHVDLVGKVGDHGADVIATTGGQDYAIQVKYSQNNTRLAVDIVGDVVRAMDFYEIDNGLCISNRNLGLGQKSKMKDYLELGYKIGSFTGAHILEELEAMPDWIKEPFTAKNYQLDCIAELKKSYDSNEDRGLISLATGMGKTYVACSFIKWLYQKDPHLNIVILAHQEELLNQFERSLWTFLPKYVKTHILTSDHQRPNFNGGVLLSTFGVFPNWYSEMEDVDFDIAVVDEAHHSRASTYERVIRMVDVDYLLGLTATPYRADGLDVTEIFGKPLVFYDVARGIQNKFLSEVDYRLRCHNIDKDWIQDRSLKGYTIKQLNKKLFIEKREELICQEFVDYFRKENRKSAVIFCQSVLHADLIKNILTANYNFSCGVITNKYDPNYNAKTLRDFRNGKLQVVTTVDMLNEGVDVPDIDFICFLRVTHSRVYFLQQLGRGLRYQKNKTLLVLDFVADLRQIKAVQRQRDMFFDSEEEFLDLESGFKLSFSNDFTDDFLDLVSKEIENEFLEENYMVE
jgi:superfamily II DNA or RNA helicase